VTYKMQNICVCWASHIPSNVNTLCRKKTRGGLSQLNLEVPSRFTKSKLINKVLHYCCQRNCKTCDSTMVPINFWWVLIDSII
jgi:hypothetical protein